MSKFASCFVSVSLFILVLFSLVLPVSGVNCYFANLTSGTYDTGNVLTGTWNHGTCVGSDQTNVNLNPIICLS